MRINNDPIVSSGDMSGNVTSESVPLDHIIGYNIHAVWTGAPTGTLKLQASDDDSTYEDVADSSTTTGGGAGSYMWNVRDVFYKYVRLVYTRTSGTGTLNARINIKGF